MSGPAFTGEDLARLEALCNADPERPSILTPDGMQAYFCAVAIGPRPPTARHAVETALGDGPDGAAVHDPALVALCSRFCERTMQEAREGSLTPLLYEKRRGRRDYQTWALGFLEGIDWWDEHWPAGADPDEVDELLFPIRVVADALSEDERRSFRPPEWRRLVLESEAALGANLARLRDYWAIACAPPQTVRRESAKVGRNDPCPCGSGRKFKLCHGA